jgi:light-harvesting complex I chlorophyll a/b binding protein 1
MNRESDNFRLVGDIPPLGYFDPLNFSKDASIVELKRFREAELHHGRIAMMASVLLPTLDILYKTPGINVLRLVDTKTQIFALWLFSMYETSRILSIYDSPFNEKTQFQLKEDSTPGQYFNTNKCDRSMLERELSNGRLAMVGMAGYITQEYLTQHPIFSL